MIVRVYHGLNSVSRRLHFCVVIQCLICAKPSPHGPYLRKQKQQMRRPALSTVELEHSLLSQIVESPYGVRLIGNRIVFCIRGGEIFMLNSAQITAGRLNVRWGSHQHRLRMFTRANYRKTFRAAHECLGDFRNLPNSLDYRKFLLVRIRVST
jgi:hypothetical protein